MIEDASNRSTAYAWSTKKTRRHVEVSPTEHVPQNERDGCAGERIVDFGPHVGLIIQTYWGPTPFGRALQQANAKPFSCSYECSRCKLKHEGGVATPESVTMVPGERKNEFVFVCAQACSPA